jgi:hypothetical protein
VGQDKEPAPAVASADLSRREQARLWVVAHASKVCRDLGVSQRQVAFNVLAEDPLRRRLFHDSGDIGPEMSRIVLTASPASVAEGLAGITGRDEMNAATPRPAIEGSKVVPDRRVTQGLVRHPRHESGRRVAFPLDESHSSIVGFGEVQPEVETCISCAERDAEQIARFRAEVGT